MVSRLELLRLLPPYMAKKKLKEPNQDTSDIINEILVAHKKFAPDYDKISSLFWKGSAIATAREIWNFLKQNVQYKAESKHDQNTKSPAAIIATGIYKSACNDCKHYSLFTAGVLDSLKRAGRPVDWRYRFANYDPSERDPGHVFVILKDRANEIWVDPVLSTFNNRKPYINAVDKNVNTMALYEMSGVGAAIGKRSAAKVAKKAAKKAARKARPKKRILLKIAAAPARNAFLALVALNIKGFAVSLFKHIKADEAKVKAKWEKLGGNYSKLKNTVMKAAKKKGLSGVAIGFAPAAALAAALPVIKALQEFLGSLQSKEALDTGAEVVTNIRDNALAQSNTGQQQQEPTYSSAYGVTPGMNVSPLTSEGIDHSSDFDAPPPPSGGGLQVRPVAAMEGISRGRLRVKFKSIAGVDVLHVTEDPKKVTVPKYVLPAALGVLIIANHKKLF